MEFLGKKNIKVTASDALEFEPVNSAPAKKGGGMRFALVLILAGGGAGAWAVYGDSLDQLWAGLWSGGEKTVPLIKAAPGPVKVRPDNPGGLRVPDRDKLVYDRMQSPSSSGGAAQNRGPERLLPSPEQPLPKPVAVPAPKAKAVERPVSEPALKPVAKIKPVEKIKPLAKPVAKPVAKVPTLKDVKTAKRPPPPPPPPQAPKAEVPGSIAKPAPKSVAPKLAAPKPVAPKLAQVKKPIAVTKPLAVPKPVPIAESRVYLVQLAAARSMRGARDEWARLRTRNLDLLGDLGLSITKADLGAARGIFYRLRAGPLKDKAAARSLCTQLAKRKVGCLIIRPDR